jgi:ferredoxin-thioredoxin reductase catalytic subunit
VPQIPAPGGEKEGVKSCRKDLFLAAYICDCGFPSLEAYGKCYCIKVREDYEAREVMSVETEDRNNVPKNRR